MFRTVYTCRFVASTKLTAFRLTDADRAYLDTLEDKLGFSKTDVLRLALRRLADIEGIEFLQDSDPLRLPPAKEVRKSAYHRLRAGDLQYLNVEDKRRKP